MNLTGKARAKSKSPNGRNKKSHPRVEAIKVTLERKKKCNDKALQIVTNFSEGTVSEKMLLDSLKFINQEHYQDIVEERAINRLCGYSLCSKTLKNIPSKQYHISTTLNKVFDITDRKNFCSNLCYKASKFLKDQVSTSPLWLREDESNSFSLISLQSKGGMSGDEVDLGMSPVKLDVDNVLTQSQTSNDDSISQDNDELTTEKSNELQINNDIESNTVNVFVNEDKPVSSENIVNHKSNSSSSSRGNKLGLREGDDESKVNDCNDSKFETLEKLNDAAKHFENNESTLCEPVGKDPVNNSEQNKSEATNTLDSATTSNTKQPPKNDASSHKHLSKRKSSKAKTPINTNIVQSVVLKIENILREWISMDSLCFLLGEEKVKEVLTEKKNQNIPAFTQDVNLYERYLAICKKLNVIELEETKIDASYRDEAKKPLPDYEALKEEARQMEIKVKMFFKGDKVQFQETEPINEKDSKSETDESQPVLPLVDVHAQKALRRRIVVDKLRKVLQDLQKSLGLKGFNLTNEVRTFVGTLTLSAHNITMKPAEWNLVAIAVIKLLSLRDPTLAQALVSSTANKHLTLLLMSFSLDAAYLDRLTVWLTDIEAVLQKT